MRRVVASSSKHALLLLAAAVPAGGLAACGEGSGTTASTPTPSVASAPATTSAPAAATPMSTATIPATPSTTATTPRAGSSSGSASSGSGGGAASFRAPRGDNSIPNFGSEAPASERARASAALSAFLRARAGRDWTQACSYLAATTRKQLETFTKASKGKIVGCGPVLAALSTGSAATRVTLAGGVAALRIKGNSAFALFRGPHNSKYVMPMLSEGGAWKVGRPAPIAYPLGSAAAAP